MLWHVPRPRWRSDRSLRSRPELAPANSVKQGFRMPIRHRHSASYWVDGWISARSGMAVPEEVHILNEFNGLNWLTPKSPPNAFQWVSERLATCSCPLWAQSRRLFQTPTGHELGSRGQLVIISFLAFPSSHAHDLRRHPLSFPRTGPLKGTEASGGTRLCSTIRRRYGSVPRRPFPSF